MKLIALAAVLAMGAPAIAQDMSTQVTMTEQDAGTNPAPGTQPAQTPPPVRTARPAGQPAQQPAPGVPGNDPMGGYQPSIPPLSGTPMAGQPVIFRAGPSPDQAYPAPAPLAEYPVCKRGQTDKCRNRGGR